MALSQRVRNELFYFDHVVFLVENDLFKIPRNYFVKNSQTFRTVFTLPPGDVDAEGVSDDHPFELRGIKAKDFESLLKVIYPPTVTAVILPREEWIAVLRLSTMWEFSAIRTFAIRELSKMELSAVEKITLGRELKVRHWLLEGFTTLAKSPGKLSLETLAPLSWETMARLLQLQLQRSVALSDRRGEGIASMYKTPIHTIAWASDTTTIDDTTILKTFKGDFDDLGDDNMVPKPRST